MKIQLGDLVWIQWADHFSTNKGGWINVDKVDIAPMLCETVGWVIKQDKDNLATSSSHDGQKDIPYVSGSYSVCPKKMIKKIRIIKKSDQRIWK